MDEHRRDRAAGPSPGLSQCLRSRRLARWLGHRGACWPGSAFFRPIRWNAGGEPTDLGTLPGHTQGRAYGVSADGSTIVGASFTSFFEPHAVRWTPTGIEPLGSLPGWVGTNAYGANADGSIIVGAAGTEPASRAFIWTPGDGMRDLNVVLADLGVNLSGWTLYAARGVSSDGTRIAGTGRNPAGVTEAWIAVIPSPASGVVLLLAALFAGRERRGRAR